MLERFKSKSTPTGDGPEDPGKRLFLKKTLEVSAGVAALTLSSGALGLIERALASSTSESPEAQKVRQDAIKMMLHILDHLKSDPGQNKIDTQAITEAVRAYQKQRGEAITGNIDDIDLNTISMEVMGR